MNITAHVFEAYLKCPTKCFLRSIGEAATGNAYADWVRVQNESYRNTGVKRQMDECSHGECVVGMLETESLKMATWRVAVNLTARGQDLESTIHAVARITPKEPSKPSQFIPIRFIYTNNVTRDDKLLLAFDALVLSEMLGSEVSLGKITHGDDYSTLKVKTSILASKVRKLTGKIATLLSSNSPPDLILNRHCAECEFKARCRQKAIETDDLSLLSGMTEKERRKQHAKGIFTVTQFSYTFRPRRTPKRAKNPAKPHYLALQALSIRENKVHIHRNPELPDSKSRVYFDIEGLPDNEFYYLIGALIVTEGQETFHRFWADEKSEERNIFTEFVEAICQLPDYRVLHYGTYEAVALRRMKAKLPEYLHPKIEAILERATNVTSVVRPHIYFPTYSNSLKDIGRFLGFEQTHKGATGLQTIVWRKTWETSGDPALKANLVRYNEDDCRMLQRVCEFIGRLSWLDSPHSAALPTLPTITRTEEMIKDRPRWELFRVREYALEDFKLINNCAYFDYQREKVFVRTDHQFRIINKRRRKSRRTKTRPNRIIEIECNRCPKCRRGKNSIEKIKQLNRLIIDLKFSRTGVKKWITKFHSYRYKCQKCDHTFTSEARSRGGQYRYGHALMSWCVYSSLFCGMNMNRTRIALGDTFEIFADESRMIRSRNLITAMYEGLYNDILQSLLQEKCLHVDETPVRLRGVNGYVWVLATMDRAYYFYKSSRESSFLKEMLDSFSGVLVSDFYTGYDSLSFKQQKCLVHFVRDIDDDLLKNPLDTELKDVAQEFGTLLRTIIQTVDRYGLKSRHLRKHKAAVLEFLDAVGSREFSSELANKYKKRFQKSGAKMFTFLDYDGVPWNNNNTEHAMKRFAKLRRHAEGRFTERSLQEYLMLVSLFETCEVNNVNILKFLLSKETTLDGLFRMAGRKKRTGPETDQSFLGNLTLVPWGRRHAEIPDEARTAARQGRYFVRKEQFKKAAQAYARAIQAAPGWPVVRFNQAVILAKFSAYKQAIDQMAYYLKFSPNAVNTQVAKNKIAMWETKVPGPLDEGSSNNSSSDSNQWETPHPAETPREEKGV
jgi:predicted RecB family nuclease